MNQPTPHEGEELTVFMARCMDDDAMRGEYPDPEARANACACQWKDEQSALSTWIGRALTYPIATGM